MEQLILISIKTKYANQIFNGTKLYEYRRKSIGEKNCNKKIFVYSSEEEKAIVGYIIVDKILEGNIDYILEATNNKNNGDIEMKSYITIYCFQINIKNIDFNIYECL